MAGLAKLLSQTGPNILNGLKRSTGLTGPNSSIGLTSPIGLAGLTSLTGYSGYLMSRGLGFFRNLVTPGF